MAGMLRRAIVARRNLRMAKRPSPLQRLVAQLQRRQGAVRASPPTDPWHAILWENVAYLTDDAHRDRALAALRDATGLDAAVIARAPDEVLAPICGLGRMAAQCVAKLRECAACFAEVGDPRTIVGWPLGKARAALRKFPGVGAPGADRLLLFARAQPLVALESNGLRALLRLGYGRAAKSYAAGYKSVVAAVGSEVPEHCDARIDLYRTMRRHGQEVCRATPACGSCRIAAQCPSRVAATR
jgi:endonuclease III